MLVNKRTTYEKIILENTKPINLVFSKTISRLCYNTTYIVQININVKVFLKIYLELLRVYDVHDKYCKSMFTKHNLIAK